jgi:hypothetical protein
MVQQMRNIVPSAGKIIIHCQNIMAVGQQPLAQVGAQETGTTGDQNALLNQVHCVGFPTLVTSQ